MGTDRVAIETEGGGCVVLLMGVAIGGSAIGTLSTDFSKGNGSLQHWGGEVKDKVYLEVGMAQNGLKLH